jgi:hypothetical protein
MTKTLPQVVVFLTKAAEVEALAVDLVAEVEVVLVALVQVLVRPNHVYKLIQVKRQHRQCPEHKQNCLNPRYGPVAVQVNPRPVPLQNQHLYPLHQHLSHQQYRLTQKK